MYGQDEHAHRGHCTCLRAWGWARQPDSPNVLAHPVGHRTSTPEATSWCWPCQRITQLLLTSLGKEWSCNRWSLSSILDSIGFFVVVAPCHQADPTGRVAGNRRIGRSGKATA